MNYKLKKIAQYIKIHGVKKFGKTALNKIFGKNLQETNQLSVNQKIKIQFNKDIIVADYIKNKYTPTKKNRKTKHIAWIIPPVSNGGGHQNIFRFVKFFEDAGFKNDIYIYRTDYVEMDLADQRRVVNGYCPAKNLTFYNYSGEIRPADVLFATSWETAYAAFNVKTHALKYYFVQDFEPTFYGIGTNYVLAENTYKFGFHGISAGKWLPNKWETYGMKTEGYDFGADKDIYKLTNKGSRKAVFFYARPFTERRGFDLGIMALYLFHEQMPDYEIYMAGEDVSGYDIPFPYKNLGNIINISELNDVYNKSAAALVLSLTNMSLLPLELMASGTIPVVNSGDNNTQVVDNQNIVYAEASPIELAKALVSSSKKNSESQISRKLNTEVERDVWQKSGEKVVKIVERDLKKYGER